LVFGVSDSLGIVVATLKDGLTRHYAILGNLQPKTPTTNNCSMLPTYNCKESSRPI